MLHGLIQCTQDEIDGLMDLLRESRSTGDDPPCIKHELARQLKDMNLLKQELARRAEYAKH